MATNRPPTFASEIYERLRVEATIDKLDCAAALAEFWLRRSMPVDDSALDPALVVQSAMTPLVPGYPVAAPVLAGAA